NSVLISDFVPGNSIRVSIDDGKFLQSEGSGSTHFTFCKGNVASVSIVVYLPNWQSNLFYVSALINNDRCFFLNKNGCRIIDGKVSVREELTVVSGKHVNGTHVLQTANAEANLATKSSLCFSSQSLRAFKQKVHFSFEARIVLGHRVR